MKALQVYLREFIETSKIKFHIPIFQREYCWKKENCERLMDDIINTADKNIHFIGLLIYKKLKIDTPFISSELETEDLFLIDGQQRITTILLLVKALDILTSDVQTYLKDKIHKLLYCINGTLKLEFSSYEKEIFSNLIKAKTFDEIRKMNKNSSIINNFEYIYNYIDARNNDSKLVEKIFNNLNRLEIITVALQKDDDEQLYFETINSLGVELKQYELIKNFLLLNSNSDSENIYYKKWTHINNLLSKDPKNNKLELFFKIYIQVKKNSASWSSDDLYKIFKEINVNKDKLEILDDLIEQLSYFQLFLYENKNEFMDYWRSLFNDYENKLERIWYLIMEIKNLKTDVLYPFFIQILSDFKNDVVDIDTLEEIFNLIISYYIRSYLVNENKNARNIIISLYNKSFKEIDDVEKKKYYYDYLFLNLEKLFPNPQLVETIFKTNKFSNQKYNFVIYLLNCIEHGRFKNQLDYIISCDTLSLEHIMPQTLTNEWRQYLGDDYMEFHDNYLNNIGNYLILSKSNNSSGSNSSFEIKKKLYEEETLYKIIWKTSEYKELKYDKQFIENRINHLYERFNEIYKYKTNINLEIRDKLISKNKVSEIDFINDDYKLINFQNIKPYSFSFLNKYHNISDISDLYKIVMNQISKTHYEKIKEIINNDNKKKLFYEFDQKHLMPEYINFYKGELFYINLNYSSADKIKNVLKVIDEVYGSSNLDFKLFYMSKN